VCEADGGWGEIEKTRREDEDEREGSAEKSIMPHTLLEITKISLVASMWHVPFIRSAKMDDSDQFCYRWKNVGILKTFIEI